MKSKLKYLTLCLVAAFFMNVSASLGDPGCRWQATSADGITLIVNLKATKFKVLDRIDATVTVQNGSNDVIAFVAEPLFMVVPYEFHDARTERQLEQTRWGSQRRRGAEMGKTRGLQLKPGEKFVFAENLNIQYDLTGVGEVKGKEVLHYVLPPRDSKKRFGSVELDGIAFQLEGGSVPLFEIIEAPKKGHRQP